MGASKSKPTPQSGTDSTRTEALPKVDSIRVGVAPQSERRFAGEITRYER